MPQGLWFKQIQFRSRNCRTSCRAKQSAYLKARIVDRKGSAVLTAFITFQKVITLSAHSTIFKQSIMVEMGQTSDDS
jgi:hypothetical protein